MLEKVRSFPFESLNEIISLVGCNHLLRAKYHQAPILLSTQSPTTSIEYPRCGIIQNVWIMTNYHLLFNQQMKPNQRANPNAINRAQLHCEKSADINVQLIFYSSNYPSHVSYVLLIFPPFPPPPPPPRGFYISFTQPKKICQANTLPFA